MFVAADQLSRDLVQGTIVADIPLFGCLDGQVAHPAGDAAWTHQGKLERGFCAILSHSCEIAPENGMKVTSYILAPLRRADKATSPAQLEVLKRANVVQPGAAYHLKYFYLEAHPAISGNDAGSVVDFSKLFSVRKTMLSVLRDGKVAQLRPEIAMMMARKLAAYFYRDQRTADQKAEANPAY